MRMYRIALILCVAAIVALSVHNARLTRHVARSEALQALTALRIVRPL